MKKEQVASVFDLPIYQEAKGYFHEATHKMPIICIEGYTALRLSIIRFGLLEPIVLYQDKIIDGRARYLACLETCALPRFEEWKGDETTLVYYIWSKNMLRGHFTEGQYACAWLHCEEGLTRYFGRIEDDGEELEDDDEDEGEEDEE